MKCNGATAADLRAYLAKFGNGPDVALPAGAGLYVAEVARGASTQAWIRGRQPIAREQKAGRLVSWAPLALGKPVEKAPPVKQAPPTKAAPPEPQKTDAAAKAPRLTMKERVRAESARLMGLRDRAR